MFLYLGVREPSYAKNKYIIFYLRLNVIHVLNEWLVKNSVV